METTYLIAKVNNVKILGTFDDYDKSCSVSVVYKGRTHIAVQDQNGVYCLGLQKTNLGEYKNLVNSVLDKISTYDVQKTDIYGSELNYSYLEHLHIAHTDPELALKIGKRIYGYGTSKGRPFVMPVSFRPYRTCTCIFVETDY